MKNRKAVASSRRTQRARPPKGNPEGHAYGLPVPEGLHAAIEIERDNLSKADSVLGCLVISMEHGGDAGAAPYYPDVAQIARDLVKRSINALDPLTLQNYLLRDRIKEIPTPSTADGYAIAGCLDGSLATAAVEARAWIGAGSRILDCMVA